MTNLVITTLLHTGQDRFSWISRIMHLDPQIGQRLENIAKVKCAILTYDKTNVHRIVQMGPRDPCDICDRHKNPLWGTLKLVQRRVRRVDR